MESELFFKKILKSVITNDIARSSLRYQIEFIGWHFSERRKMIFAKVHLQSRARGRRRAGFLYFQCIIMPEQNLHVLKKLQIRM